MGFLSCGKSKCSPHQDINIQSSQEWLHPTWFLQWLQLQPQLLRLALGVPTHPPSPPLHQCQSHVPLRGAPPTCTHGTPSGRHGSGAHAWDPHLPRGLDLEQRQLFHRRPCRAARGLGIQRQRRRKMNGSIDEQLGCPKRLKHPSEGG